ncbi:MAG: hypothetical protein K8W52_45440 [Deltaproteobacteria bacterium]|nr:hypothetical protein [Deltaproteobacteria bacterium]
MPTLRALAVLALLASACAHDVSVRYPFPVDAPTGAMAFVFTRAASDVTVAVNGALAVRGAHTERVTIAQVPTGFVDVVIAAGPEEKAFKVWIDEGKTTTVPLGSPGVSPIDGWRAAFVSLASVVLYAVLR